MAEELRSIQTRTRFFADATFSGNAAVKGSVDREQGKRVPIPSSGSHGTTTNLLQCSGCAFEHHLVFARF
jgi:hypothetical protein